jgi:ferrous iron transport protein A
MRDNLIRMCAHDCRASMRHAMSPLATLSLNQLPDGGRGTVARVVSASADIDAVALRRLGELGFLPGEPVQLLRRGPGGREPLAVMIGETMFALRLLEAQCIEVTHEAPSLAALTAPRGGAQHPPGGRAGAAAPK